MPKVQNVPTYLKPYLFHGLALDWSMGGQATAEECPFCGRGGKKFRVNVDNGLWDCKVCGEKGNAYVFIRKLWEDSAKRGCDRLNDLATDRKILSPSTLTKWGVVQSHLTFDWALAGHNQAGNLNQLYRYINRIVMATPTLNHQLFGMTTYDRSRPTIYVTEGPWDGMALWEVVDAAKDREASVLAVPGCNVFSDAWLPLFEGKWVVLLFDNDHPKENKGRTSRAGYDGMQRAAKILAGTAKGIHYLHWGDEGFDPALPSGYDVRDWVSRGSTASERIALWKELMRRTKPIPKDWAGDGTGRTPKPAESPSISCSPCQKWSDMIMAWRKALKWTDGLDRALAVMLASVTSTKAVGDQLWVKVIGPAASGKSTLCEALSVNKQFVVAKSTLRGFHSGFDDGSGENYSPLREMIDKTLVIKDGDALLQAPNIEQILSEARDVYDRVSRSSYRSKQSKDWQGLNITIILCGTASLRQLDSSELGERFLDVVIMESIDDDLEDEILWRVVNRADRSMAFESDGNIETQHDPDLVRAMQLTGGYVGWLRENARDLLATIDSSEEALKKCARLGKFVAFARARPSDSQDETAEREFASRLASQHVRLAKCLAAVLNRKSLDDEVMKRVTRVAMDTARGRTLEIIKYLYNHHKEGAEVKGLAIHTNCSEEGERKLLRFLRKIGAAETFTTKHAPTGLTTKVRWRLTQRLFRLYEEVTSKAKSEDHADA